MIILLFSHSLMPHPLLQEAGRKVSNNFPTSQLHEGATIIVMF